MITYKSPSHSQASARLLGIMLATIGSASSTFAAAGSWLGSTDSTWAGANWSASPSPAAGEIATFNGAGNGNTVIDLGAGVSVGSIIFDSASVVAYTIGSGGAGAQTLTLGDTGAAVTINSTVAANQLFNANLLLGSAIAGTTLTFAGNISGGTGGTAGIKSLNVAAAANTNTIFTGSFSAGGATGINLTNTTSGTVTLGGSGNSSLNILRASANGLIVINGPIVNVAAEGVFGGNSTTHGRLDVQAGVANYNGGIRTNNSVADNTLIKISGGTLNTTNITLGRTSNPGTAIITSGNVTQGSGFVVTSGSASLSGNLTLGTSNSAATGHISGGTVNIAGVTTLGATTNSRNNILQVSGGILSSSNTTGLVLSSHATTANLSELYITGGTTTFERVQFGGSTAAASSTGAVVLNGSGALYLGSGGIVLGSPNAYNVNIDLRAGTVGAKADWSSSLAMSLNGAGAVTFKAADASDVAQNISLSGVISGSNGFTKTGGGTLTLSGANTYAGVTTINAGSVTLGANDVFANTSSVVLNGGSLSAATFTDTLGTLNLTASSGITLGSGGSFAFADSSSLDWGSFALSISGSFVDSQSIRFGSSSTGLTPAQLALININGQSAGIDLNGYLTAVPEPSAFALLAGLAGMGCVGLRRRRRA
jgi:autotransporter-associated beta strand protein